MRKSLLLTVVLALSVPASAAPPSSAIREKTPRTAAIESTTEIGSISSFVAGLKADSDGAAQNPAAPSRSLQEAISRILPPSAGAPRCLTPVMQEVSRQSAASPVFASSVEKVLAPPALSREIVQVSPDGNVILHYTLDRASGDAVLAVDRDGNGAPDYVDLLASYLTAAREAIVTRMGFRLPSVKGPLDVYLVNLGGRIDGYSSMHVPEDAAFIVLDSRLLGNDALLRAAVAHQYAHAVLAAYAPAAPIWWIEASSTWLEGAVVGSYAHYADMIQSAVEHASAGLAFDDPRACQGHLIWPAYLATLGAQGSLVRTIWENLDQQAGGADLWQATDDALRTLGLSLERAFSDYSLWLVLSGERNDGRHFAIADRLEGVALDGDITSYPAAQIQSASPVAGLGAAFVRFEADSLEGGLRLRFEGDLPGAFQAQVLLTPRKEGAPLVRAPILIDARGRGSIGIPWATFTEAILIVGNVARSAVEAPYSFVARAEPVFPFEIVSFGAEASTSDVRLTWETQSENGLFGWIVYRSERARGAGNRVNEFIIPAIGEGDGPVSYQYTDDDVARGRTYFYRLVGVTQDGLTRETPEARIDLPR